MLSLERENLIAAHAALLESNASEAAEMIAEVKGLAVIRGYRNLPLGDVKALASAVAAFSRICAMENVAEAEINPVIVKERGVVAVDALVVLDR